MSGVPSQSARLGSIGWAFHSFSGAKAAGGAGAPQKQSTSQTAGDIIDLSVARKSASGSAIKDRVLKVDGQIKTLTGQLKETHAALETAKGQREGLKKQLSEKLLESQQNQTETGGAEADRAKNEADIALLRQQVQALDVTIDGLKAQQQDLAGKAIALVGQNRQAYDEANGGKNYAKYLESLPPNLRNSEAVKQALAQTNTPESQEALARLKATEHDLAVTEGTQKMNQWAEGILTTDENKLKGEVGDAQSQLEATNRFIAALKARQQQLQGTIGTERKQLSAADTAIQKKEELIIGLESQIAQLQDLRDQILTQAIADKTADGEAIAAKIAQLNDALTKLQGALKKNQGELQELKQLQQDTP